MDPALNPYRAPASEIDPRPPAEAGGPLATRNQRFGGATVDGLLALVAYAIVYFGMSLADVAATEGNLFRLYFRSGGWGLASGAAVLGLSILQWYLITTRGQTLGKMVANSRIVRLDGQPVDFLHGVALRNWVIALPSWLLPLVGISTTGGLGHLMTAVGIVDALFIFRADHRCLHDLMAGTKVIDLSPPAPPAPRA
jgi:uncharacterized RDD family membrane protein YckC